MRALVHVRVERSYTVARHIDIDIYRHVYIYRCIHTQRCEWQTVSRVGDFLCVIFFFDFFYFLFVAQLHSSTAPQWQIVSAHASRRQQARRNACAGAQCSLYLQFTCFYQYKSTNSDALQRSASPLRVPPSLCMR